MDYPKLCLIMPFYGEWPSFFNLYLKGCESNSFIDFIFFTDNNPPDQIPPNVRFVKLSLEELNEKVKDKLGIVQEILNPYKICDFRPAFGFIFQDYISKYDFWGHGDIDLVYGNIRNFISQGEFESYEILSFRKEWISGSLAFFKNSEKVNKLFLKNNDYKIVFESKENFAYDECGKAWDLVRNVSSILMIPQDITNITRIVKEEEQKGNLKCYFRTQIKESIGPCDFIIYDNGKITSSSNKEFLLYHFITEKRFSSFTYPDWKVIPEKYYINRFGFFTVKEFRGYPYFLISSKRRMFGLVKIIANFPKRVINKFFK